ncbi:MAG: sugar phosphate isomerase/epimerase [Candidatus Solibacter usitatus]|nr:sugar phosphate isomerase/epimerase [Candidatus Solibacter usitatus]
MRLTRRAFLEASAGMALSAPAAAKKITGLKIGVTDWNLRKAGDVAAVGLAQSLGFDGVEVSLGRKPVDNRLPLDSAEIQERYLAEARKHNLHLAGACLDILHVNYLKNDKLGQKWVADAIPITRKLDARVILLPFFGRGALRTNEEMAYVADVLKELGPEAAKAQILLGIENTISAEDNARILDRVASPAVKVYYDIGNSARGGFPVVREIRWLGKDRICQFHLKDNPHYLGEGAIDLPGVMKAISDLKFEGFANLETDTPSKSVENDMARNLKFIRDLAHG